MNDRHPPPAGGRTGMWLFIATEFILFGGLFLLYSMYRFKNAEGFHAGSMELSRFFGGLNLPQVADYLGVSLRTVEGDWSMARAWLRRELRDVG